METQKNQPQSAKQITKGKKREMHAISEGGKTSTRYSDEDLKEFKELISAKLHTSKIDYELLTEALTLKAITEQKTLRPLLN